MVEFMKYRYYSYVFSLLFVILSLFLISWRGLNLGLDFTGGTLIEVRFDSKVSLGEVRKGLLKAGIEAFQVQDTAQNTVILRLRTDEPKDKALEAAERIRKPSAC